MTDQAQIDPNVLPALQMLLGQMQGQSTTPATGGWAKPAAPAAPAEILGVSIPISVETPAGKIRCYLNFPAAAAASPATLMALLEQLAAAGLPLDTWQPRESGSGSSWGNNNSGNGRNWNNNSGNGRHWRR